MKIQVCLKSFGWCGVGVEEYVIYLVENYGNARDLCEEDG